MTKEQLKALVAAKIAGQGMQIDAGSTLPTIFGELIDKVFADSSEIDALGTTIGSLADLQTDHKSNLVAAINELAGITETAELVVSTTKTAEELKAIYDLVVLHPQLAKNIVVVGADGLNYAVNGYGIVEELLHLHTIMDVDGVLTDSIIKINSAGSIIV